MNTPAPVDNPFGKSQSLAGRDTIAASESERSIQEVQAAMVIAKKFPRDTIEAMDRILNACTRPTLAETALYSYPRGGQEVTGPSIRLAEALAQEWGNLQFGIRELSQDGESSTVEAFAWDVQTNTRQLKVFRVPHARFAKGQLKKLTDPRDIYEMIANQGARRLRACILGIIPGDVVESAVRQCEVTQSNNIEVTPDSIKKMLETFETWGVPKELVEKRVGRRAESINAPQMLSLRKVHQSLKDGMSKPSDWFDMDTVEETVGPKSSDLNAEILRGAPADKKPPAKGPAAEKSGGQKKGSTPKQSAKKAASPKTDASEEKPPAEDGAAASGDDDAGADDELTYPKIMDAINKAKDAEALAVVGNFMIPEFLGQGDNGQFKEELTDAYRSKQDRLKAEQDEVAE